MLLTLMFFCAAVALVVIAFGTLGELWDVWRHPDQRSAQEDRHEKTRLR